MEFRREGGLKEVFEERKERMKMRKGERKRVEGVREGIRIPGAKESRRGGIKGVFEGEKERERR